MSPSQASETCASASSATSANGNSLYESRFNGVKKPGSIQLQRADQKTSSLSVSTSVTPVAPIRVRVSPIRGMPSPPIIAGAVGAITIADAVSIDTVSSIGLVSSRSATVPTSVTRVVAIHELGALLIRILVLSAAATTALGHRRGRNRQQQN